MMAKKAKEPEPILFLHHSPNNLGTRLSGARQSEVDKLAEKLGYLYAQFIDESSREGRNLRRQIIEHARAYRKLTGSHYVRPYRGTEQ